ncbi:GGDEF domain-containing protein, partial [Aeromicrobium sp.]|uniref:GGDEF domain-containing protein n=1 Tax=Aeromicrobium sp. TaxID=1871063 RepID=UPI003C41E802
AAWHRQARLWFSGVFLTLVFATIVTDSFGMDAVVALLGVGVAIGSAYGLLVATAQIGRRWSLLLWPVGTCAGISVVDRVAHVGAGLVLGLVVLSFLYIGMSQVPHLGLWFVLPATLLVYQVGDLTFPMALIRLPIAAVVWVICCEGLAALIRELKDKTAELERLAATDSLTGLLNRTRLDAFLERAGTSGAVGVIDIDHFKPFNDLYGHVKGDAALVEFAAVLVGGVRPGDGVFRFGGDEFLVILVDASVEDAGSMIERIRDVWSTNPSGLTFSAGVAQAGPDAVRTADDLLYRGKRHGRDQVVRDEGDPEVATAT